MAKKVCSVPFSGTAEQEAKLRALIEKNKDDKGALMPVLHGAQEIYGYLPEEVQKIVADGLDVSLEEVYQVATFYAQFSLAPKGKYNIAVCLGTACYVKGAGKLMEKCEELLGISCGGLTSDLKFSLDATRCIGACGLAPVLTIGEDVYGRLEPNMLPDIIKKYR